MTTTNQVQIVDFLENYANIGTNKIAKLKAENGFQYYKIIKQSEDNVAVLLLAVQICKNLFYVYKFVPKKTDSTDFEKGEPVHIGKSEFSKHANGGGGVKELLAFVFGITNFKLENLPKKYVKPEEVQKPVSIANVSVLDLEKDQDFFRQTSAMGIEPLIAQRYLKKCEGDKSLNNEGGVFKHKYLAFETGFWQFGKKDKNKSSEGINYELCSLVVNGKINVEKRYMLHSGHRAFTFFGYKRTQLMIFWDFWDFLAYSQMYFSKSKKFVEDEYDCLVLNRQANESDLKQILLNNDYALIREFMPKSELNAYKLLVNLFNKYVPNKPNIIAPYSTMVAPDFRKLDIACLANYFLKIEDNKNVYSLDSPENCKNSLFKISFMEKDNEGKYLSKPYKILYSIDNKGERRLFEEGLEKAKQEGKIKEFGEDFLKNYEKNYKKTLSNVYELINKEMAIPCQLDKSTGEERNVVFSGAFINANQINDKNGFALKLKRI